MVLNLVKGVTLFFLTGLGTMGNIFVFMNYICIIGGTEKIYMHLILIHLVFTNTILLLSKGIPSTIAAFGLRIFLDIIGCKIVIYLERVARGVSICTSSLLTVVQAITISPRHCVWKRLQPKSAWHILPLLLFFWILNSLLSMNVFSVITNINLNSSQIDKSDFYCGLPLKKQKINFIFVTLMALRDTAFQSLMGGSSVYIVFLLHRHHQRVLYLKLSKFFYKTPPEIKAAQSVLILMLSFLFFYWTDCAISLYFIVSFKNASTIVNLQVFLTLGYAVLCPFVLIHRDGHLVKCCHSQ
ncbi:vomeronasal type-1 receptor 4-like [Fukomys damarensis]|uniref:vomeronasal type-1 receptor 4-like n=1 Tax=Fukomys damarensis TaxID=885580 RepID=UPI00053F3787|nr:vomeronasal type-1 receptor 4-like [Fukomys damarensis]